MSSNRIVSAHWGWRLVNGQAVFSSGSSPAVSTREELTQDFYVIIAGTRKPDGQPSLAVKVTRELSSSKDCDQQVVYDAWQHHYRFHVCFLGVALTWEELDLVINAISKSLHARQQ